MKLFISSTIGLMCRKSGAKSYLVRVQMCRMRDGSVELRPVSGWTMDTMRGTIKISAAAYDGRPTDAYDNTVEAIWAMRECGWFAVQDES